MITKYLNVRKCRSGTFSITIIISNFSIFLSMKRVLFLLLALCSIELSAQVNLVQWNFNSAVSDSLSSTGTLNPSTNNCLTVPAISVVGGVTSTFSSGGSATSGSTTSSTDPESLDDSGLQTTGYPAAGTGNKTAGVQVSVNTTGFRNITVTWDQRHSNTSANTWQLQYSTDSGDNFFDAPNGLFTFVPGASATSDVWYNGRTVSLSSISSLNNNANVIFRVVAAYDPTAGNYLASRSTSTYGPAGTARFDMFTVSGTSIPTGIEEVVSYKQLNAYPNPITAGQELQMEKVGDYSLYDLTGRLLYAFQNTQTITTAGLGQGLYIVRDGENALLKLSVL